MKRKNGFTLIELLAVIVILAVIALIATPLIMNTINDARDSAMQRSVQNIQHAVEQHVMSKKVLDENYTFTMSDFNYKGEKYDKMNIGFNDKDEAGVAVYKDNKCYYVLAGSSNVVIDKELDEAGCLAKAGEVVETPVIPDTPDTPENGITYVAPEATDTHKGIVYLDPTNLANECNADNSVSTTEVAEGCMKWYIYDDSGDTYKMILDHNTTARAQYNSDNVNTSMKEVADALIEDITNWDSSIKSTARLIRAQDIANITGKTSFNSETTQIGGWFYFDSNNQTQSANSTNKSKYAWLYDNTNGCINYGCNIQDQNSYTIYGKTTTGTTYGYWTSDAVYNNSASAWVVNYDGNLYFRSANFETYGVRPVISISKSIVY